MYRVTREIYFCYGHRLLNYEGKCRYLHGHNGRAVITLAAPALDSPPVRSLEFVHARPRSPPAARSASGASIGNGQANLRPI